MGTQAHVATQSAEALGFSISSWNSQSAEGARNHDTAAGLSVLIAGDDMPLARLLHRELHSKSFLVHTVHDTSTAFQMLESSRFDLAVLDLSTTPEGGIHFLRRVRAKLPDLPVLKLIPHNRVEDRVNSLDNGADDCLSKPFSLLELTARIRSLMRRRRGYVAPESKVADLTLNRDEHRVQRNGHKIDLTPREFAILEFLIRNAGRPVSRATLVEEVWKTPYDPSSNIVDVYVKYVRDKVDGPGERKLIHTIRGIGYTISEEH